MKSKGPFLVAQAPPAIAGRPPLPAPGDRLFYRQGARLLCGIFILLTWLSASAQNPPDSSAPKQDTIVPVTVVSVAGDSAKAPHSKKKILPKKLDTLLATAVPATRRDFTQQFGGEPPDGWFRAALARNSYFNFLGQALAPLAQIHLRQGFDLLFYFLAALLFYFALIKLFFGKYLSNLFTLFFKASMRQQQIREQVLQAPQPSLLLNILFVLSGGLYLTFLIRYLGFSEKGDFWALFLKSSAVLSLIYLVKFLLLRLSGWIFSVQRATDTYIFIVFLTNKIMGICLLPFLVILSFSNHFISEILITLSMLLVGAFFVNRFLAAVGPVRKEIKVSSFHFFLYLCAFEIAPLLLIYKVLLTYLEKS